MSYLIQLRRANAASWVLSNPVLADGEIGLERDTQHFKVGDGVTDWNSLAYHLIGPQGEPGQGDMNKSVYDTDDDGVVDNSKKLDGRLANELILNGGYF